MSCQSEALSIFFSLLRTAGCSAPGLLMNIQPVPPSLRTHEMTRDAALRNAENHRLAQSATRGNDAYFEIVRRRAHSLPDHRLVKQEPE